MSSVRPHRKRTIRGIVGLLTAFTAQAFLLAWSLALVVKGGTSIGASLLFLYSVLSLHFLARIASPRQRWYVARWQRLIGWLSIVAPLSAASAALAFGPTQSYWLLLLAVVLVASAGMWAAVKDRIKQNDEVRAA